MNYLSIGDIIKKIRKDNNLTQEELGVELNVTSSAVSNWERGKNLPDFEILNIVSEKYNVSKDELFDGILSQKKVIDKEKALINTHKYLLMFITFLIVLLMILTVYLVYSKPVIYKISSDKNIFFTGRIIKYKDDYSIIINNIDYLEKYFDNFYSLEYSIIIDDKTIYKYGSIEEVKENGYYKSRDINTYLNSIVIYVDDLSKTDKNKLKQILSKKKEAFLRFNFLLDNNEEKEVYTKIIISQV